MLVKDERDKIKGVVIRDIYMWHHIQAYFPFLFLSIFPSILLTGITFPFLRNQRISPPSKAKTVCYASVQRVKNRCT